MTFKLTYHIGPHILHEWYFHSKALAYWYKNELLWSGRYNDGKFKVTPC